MWFWCCQEQDENADVVVQTYAYDCASEMTAVVAASPVLVSLQPKARPEVPPLQPPQSWTVELSKAPELGPLGLGLDIDVHQRLAILKEPEAGPALAWNCMHPGKRLLGGDIIESVNGCSGDAQELLELINESDVVVLNMTRLVDFTVSLEKQGSLGLEVAERDGRVVVESVLEGGSVEKHNTKCLAGYRVTPDNWLIAVNDRSGKPQDLMQKLQALESGPILLRFQRTPPN